MISIEKEVDFELYIEITLLYEIYAGQNNCESLKSFKAK
jgi:hypothetical protein